MIEGPGLSGPSLSTPLGNKSSPCVILYTRTRRFCTGVWCRGKFVAPGKFFPPPYCHNVTNANPNPNLNPSFNPNPNFNSKFNPIPNFNPNPYCCVWE